MDHPSPLHTLRCKHTQRCVHARTHTHTRSVTIIRIDNARNLLRSGLNRDLCVRRLPLSLFLLPLPLSARRVSLDHSRCVLQSLTCTHSVLLYITGTPLQTHTPIPISPTGPKLRASIHILTHFLSLSRQRRL